MNELDEIDDEEGRDEENPDPNGGPSVAGLLLIGFGAALFFHPPFSTEWMSRWAVSVLNWPIGGGMIGGGIGMFSGNGARGARYGALACICIAALSWLTGRLNTIGH